MLRARPAPLQIKRPFVLWANQLSIRRDVGVAQVGATVRTVAINLDQAAVGRLYGDAVCELLRCRQRCIGYVHGEHGRQRGDGCCRSGAIGER